MKRTWLVVRPAIGTPLSSRALKVTTGALLISTSSIVTRSDVADEADSNPVTVDSPSAPSSPSSPVQALSAKPVSASTSRIFFPRRLFIPVSPNQAYFSSTVIWKAAGRMRD